MCACDPQRGEWCEAHKHLHPEPTPETLPRWDVNVHMLIEAESQQEAENVARTVMWETPETVRACRIDTPSEWSTISGRRPR